MPCRPERERMAMCSRAPIAWLAMASSLWCLRIATAAPVAQELQRTDLIQDMPTAGDLAAPANGQTLYVLDESRGEVVAIDPFEPTKRWIALAAGDEKAVASRPLAIGCIDTSMLAVLSRTVEGWALQTHRLSDQLDKVCERIGRYLEL